MPHSYSVQCAFCLGKTILHPPQQEQRFSSVFFASLIELSPWICPKAELTENFFKEMLLKVEGCLKFALKPEIFVSFSFTVQNRAPLFYHQSWRRKQEVKMCWQLQNFWLLPQEGAI